jgi:DNA (cytosine-5)-methyltransferase 1
MNLHYNWSLKDAVFTKDKGKVFSCFACGGGSTMGYKLAGFDVIGCNEIDKKMMQVYEANHAPKYAFLQSITDFKMRDDLPSELYELDILDGSPPCSSFSMSGSREKDWGKEKKFREGQSLQVLDTLFFDFIDLAKKLQPKVVIAENVKGLLMGSAKHYVRRIYSELDSAGYYCQHFLLDASKMGVPQRRERVFFIALRKDLSEQFLTQKDMFTTVPTLDMLFSERIVPFKDIADNNDLSVKDNTAASFYWDKTPIGKDFKFSHPKGHFFNDSKSHPDLPIQTITASITKGVWHYSVKRLLNDVELIKAGSFPFDYNFLRNKVKYIIGMSVPPLMIARIANEVHRQWLSKIIVK